jgi:hypothetical protein
MPLRLRILLILLALSCLTLIGLVVFGGFYPRPISLGLIAGSVASILALLTQKSESTIVKTLTYLPGIVMINLGIPRSESGDAFVIASGQLLASTVLAVALFAAFSVQFSKTPTAGDA